MRRNMQEVLERWGRWAISEEKCTSVDWPAMSVTPARLPVAGGGKSCSDDDGLMIDGCVSRFKKLRDREDVLILGLRYIGGLPLRQIAEALNMDLNAVRRSLYSTEAFLEGCLATFCIPLDMDPEVCE